MRGAFLAEALEYAESDELAPWKHNSEPRKLAVLNRWLLKKGVGLAAISAVTEGCSKDQL